MQNGKQATPKSKVLVNPADREALERILGRHPAYQNLTDAVRHAIHFTDRFESEADRTEGAA